MKSLFALVSFFVLLSSAAFGKIIIKEDRVFLKSKGKEIPLIYVNKLVSEGAVTKVKLFGEGRVPLISFGINDEGEKLYSVDEKGFVYSITPFTDYEVTKVTDSGEVQFKQSPGKLYKINSKGFFLY